MPRPNAAARLQGAGGCDTFYAVRSYVNKGVQVCDIVNPDGMMVYIGCPVFNGQANRIGAPTTPWSGELDAALHPQVIAIYRSLGRSPIILGKLNNEAIEYSLTEPVQETEEVAVSQTALKDVAIANDQSKLVMKHEGGGGDVVLVPGHDFRVQLGNEGKVRISGDGDRPGETSDGPVLASPYADRDAEIVALLRAIVAHLSQFVTEPPFIGLPGGTKTVNPNAGAVRFSGDATYNPAVHLTTEGLVGNVGYNASMADVESAAIQDLNLSDVKSAVLALSSKVGG